jgi:hypothetical protein
VHGLRLLIVANFAGFEPSNKALISHDQTGDMVRGVKDMRTMSRISAMGPVRAAYRVSNSVVVLGILVLAGALATWGGVSPRIVLPVAGVVLAIVLFTFVRRALRDASARIDTILREELGPAESPVEQSVEMERRQCVVDDHRGRAGDAGPISRAGLDDAQLGGRQRQ